eukprot:1161486-Pelagomonas_calceolata.AAC.6
MATDLRRRQSNVGHVNALLCTGWHNKAALQRQAHKILPRFEWGWDRWDDEACGPGYQGGGTAVQ